MTCLKTSSCFLNSFCPESKKSSNASSCPFVLPPALISLPVTGMANTHRQHWQWRIQFCTHCWEALDELHFSTLQQYIMLQPSSVKYVFSTIFIEIIIFFQCYWWKHRKELATGRLLHLLAVQMNIPQDVKHCIKQSNVTSAMCCSLILSTREK